MCLSIKSIRTLLLSALLVVATSCSNNEARKLLIAEVERSNSLCPVSLGANGSLTSVTYDDNKNEVTMSYLMNEHYMNPEAFDASNKQNKEAMATYLQSDEGRRFLEMLDRADASISLSFMIGGSGPHVVSLSSEDIDSISSGIRTIDGARRQLSDVAKSENCNCPTMLSADMRIDSVSIENHYLTYLITVSDSLQLSTSEQLAATRDMLKQVLIDTRSKADVSRTLNLLSRAEYGLRYRISINKDDGQSDVVIDLTPEEVTQIAPTQY